MSGYFYISFATEEEFLGATVVKAKSPVGAVEEASRLGINPGGEALTFHLPPGFDPKKPEYAPFINRLIEQEELVRDHGGVRRQDMEPEMMAVVDNLGVIVCGEHNQA